MGIEDHFATVVFELAPDAMAVTDEYGRMVHVNGRFETVFGFDRDDLVGRTVEVLLPDRLKAVHRSHRREYELRPRPRPMGDGRRLWARHRDGTEFLVEVSLSPVSTADGQCTIMAVRAASETPSTDPRGEADGPVRESFFHDLDAGVIRPIFSASLGLHGLLDGAAPGQAEVLRHAIAELDEALRSLRHLALEHTLLARAPDGGVAPPDHHQAREEPPPARTESGPTVEYVIDADDVVVSFDGAWTAFARDNDAPELAQLSPERQLWSYFETDEVRELWQVLVARVRAEQVEARVPFRCDSPSRRRWFHMTITPGADDTVRFRSVCMFEQVRSTAVPLLDRHAERDQTTATISLCSWCGQGHDGTRWLDLEDLVREQRLLERIRVPPTSHGICPACRAAMRATLSTAGDGREA